MRTDPGAAVSRIPTPPTTYGSYPDSGSYADTYGSGSASKKVKWKSYSVAGAPQWWRGRVPSAFNAKTAYASIANAILPYLSPEDQRSVATNLALNYTQFAGYNPTDQVSFGAPPAKLESAVRQAMTSAQRAEGILSALTKMQKTSKAKPGAGMKFLQQVATVMRDYGGRGNNNQTRRQQMEMMGALDPLVQGASTGKTAPYTNLAQMMAKPYFTGGNVVPVSKDQTGKWTFGQYNQDF